MYLHTKIKSWFIIGLLLVCNPLSATNLRYNVLTFSQLKGWNQATVIETFNDYLTLNKTIVTQAKTSFQHDLNRLDKTNNKQIKQFIEKYYEPVMIINSHHEHLLTGYHIFHAKADYKYSKHYSIPIYQKPQSQEERYHTHEAILAGALSGKELELAWLQDSVDLYLLMMQGSGLLTFPDEQIKKVIYSGSNGYGYKSISKYMLNNKLITEQEQNGPFIKQYLKQDLQRAKTIIIQNPSYVFFKFDTKTDFSGAAGSTLKAMQSLAIDTRYYPFHNLIWLETTLPNHQDIVSNLVITQDTGGAIKGPQRGDLFFGIKKEAEEYAGLMKDKNVRLIMLRLRHYD
tara:strand:+ start:2881 stop:3909 length:1029 start_codon:yes stop_codon:yes gene_type:complete